jgi:unspecific monooxygenase
MNEQRTCRLPGGPDLTPEQAVEAERQPLDAFEQWSESFGPDFTVAVNGVPSRVFLSSPEAIHQVFVNAGSDLRSSGSTAFRSIVGEHSVIFLNGVEHLAVRRLLGWPLMGNQMRSHGEFIEQQAKTALVEAAGAGPISLIGVTRRMTLQVLVRLVFGDLPPDRAERAGDLCSRLISALRPGGGGESIGSLCAALDHFIATEIAGRASSTNPARTDLVGHLLEHRGAGADRLSDQQIRGHVVSLLVAGFETTASTLAWAALLVAQHGEIRDRLRTTLRELGDVGPDRTAQEPYVVAVCREVLRLSSVVPTGLTRYSSVDIVQAGYTIPPGTEVVPCIHAAHRRADTYPDPLRFDPSRFLGRRYGNDEYLPFGVGSRRCLGAAFAGYELAIALAVMYRTPGFEILDPHEPVRPAATGPTMAFPEDVFAVVNAGPEPTEETPERATRPVWFHPARACRQVST